MIHDPSIKKPGRTMNPRRTQDAVESEFLRFQFKLFANNVTKFGAPDNRASLYILLIHSFFLSSLKNEDLKELINKVFISSKERFNAACVSIKF